MGTRHGALRYLTFGRVVPSFFRTKTIGEAQGDVDSCITPAFSWLSSIFSSSL